MPPTVHPVPTTVPSPAVPAFEPIAIVGMGVRMPGADTVEELHALLSQGRDLVGPPSAERLTLGGLDPAVGYGRMSALRGIEEFDHEFFGITPAEAEAMDPHQRLTLQLACAAVENAGYRLSALSGRACGVFLAAPRPDYAGLVGDSDVLTLLGTQPSALAGRVSYLLGLHGPAVVLDTGCSSALVALHYACRELAHGAIDTALAGGLSLHPVLTPGEGSQGFSEILSADGVCRAFDADATGTSPGEGGGVLLLKRLDRALADGDTVHAVLRSLALNHNGHRSNGFSAPGLTAQVEVITQAWQQAGADLSRFGLLEAHGSGTRLGDMIEIEAVQRVLTSAGAGRHACAIGSVKTNIGHLGNAAGIAGLIKAVLQIRFATRYASLHFERPNPQLAAHGEPAHVQARTEPWTSEGPRIAGVSSFTLVGTNAHAVLEQAPEPPVRPAPAHPDRPDLATVSAKSPAALERLLEALRGWLPTLDERDLPDALFVMNAGRDDHPYRVAFPVTDSASLEAGLRTARPPREAARDRRLVLVLGDPGSEPPDPAWAEVFPAYRLAWDECGADLPPAARHQYAVVRLLEALGVEPALVIGAGRGRALARALRGELSPSAAWAEPHTPPADVAARTAEVVGRLAAGEPSAFRVLGEVDDAFEALAADRHDHARWDVRTPAELPAAVAGLYTAGIGVDWDAWYAGEPRRRVELPTYPFEPTRCWPQVTPAARVAAPVAEEEGADPDGDVEDAIIAIFQDALKISGADRDSDYFDLGGNSVLGLSVLERVNRRFRVKLTLPALYESSTVSAMADLVRSRAYTAEASTRAGGIPRITGDGPFRPSHGQEALWFLDQFQPGVAMYNVPHDMHLRGPLDVAAMRTAMAAMEQRHTPLRTRYVDVDGAPMVLLRQPDENELEFVDLSGVADQERRTALAAERLRAAAADPMDLSTGPLYRKVLIKLAEDDHILLLVAHHSVYDGWTPAILDRDLWELYDAALHARPADLPELPISYLDYAAWQRERLAGERREELLGFWRGNLAGAAASVVPTGKPRPEAQSGRGAGYRFTVPEDVMAGLRELSARQRGSLFMTLLTALNTLIARYSGEPDVVIGTTTAGRTHPDILELIGYFNNAIALRTDLGGDPTFREAMSRTRRTVIDGIDHDDLPFAMLVADLQPVRDASRHPVFQIVYVHQNAADVMGELSEGLRYRFDRQPMFGGLPPGTAKWDLTLAVMEMEDRTDLPAVLEYATDLYDEPQIARLADAFLTLLRGIVADPDAKLSELPLTTGPVRERLLRAGDGPGPAGDGVLVASGPPDEAVARLAGRLRARGVRPGGTVAGLATGSEAATAFLATLAVGAVYVPCDPTAPAERQTAILERAAPTVRLTGTDTGPLVKWHGMTLAVDGPAGPAAPARTPEPGDAAIALYRGGKSAEDGLVLDHRALAAAWGSPAAADLPELLAGLLAAHQDADPLLAVETATDDPRWSDLAAAPAGSRFYVLGPDLLPVPHGVPGELFAAGTAAGLGHRWHAWGSTPQTHVPDPFAGDEDARMRRTGRRARITARDTVQVWNPVPVAARPSGPVGGDAAPDAGPATPLETSLGRIWSAMLGAEVGRHDNFFELGGHSLMAMALMSRVHTEHGVRLPVTALFDNPTVHRLAAVVDAAGGRITSAPSATLQSHGDDVPLFCLHPKADNTLAFHSFARTFAPDHPVLGVRAEPPNDEVTPERRVDNCLSAIRALRPKGPYRLLGWEYGAVLAAEAARRLTEAGERVTFVGLVEPPGAAPRDTGYEGRIHRLRTAGGDYPAPRGGDPVVEIGHDLGGQLRGYATDLATAVRAAWSADDATGGAAAEAGGHRVELRPDRPGSEPTGAVTVRPFRLTDTVGRALGWQPGGPPPAAGAVAAVAALTARLTGEHDIVVGLRETGAEHVLPVRVDTGGDPDLGVLVKRAEVALAAARGQAAAPLSADPDGRHPLCSVAVEVGDPATDLATPAGRLDLLWRVRGGQQTLSGALLCDADRFLPRTAKRLVDCWRQLLQAAAEPGVAIGAVPLPDPAVEPGGPDGSGR